MWVVRVAFCHVNILDIFGYEGLFSKFLDTKWFFTKMFFLNYTSSYQLYNSIQNSRDLSQISLGLVQKHGIFQP